MRECYDFARVHIYEGGKRMRGKTTWPLHTTLRTVTDVKRRYTKHCVNKMADSNRPGKFLTLLTLERSSFRENAT